MKKKYNNNKCYIKTYFRGKKTKENKTHRERIMNTYKAYTL